MKAYLQLLHFRFPPVPDVLLCFSMLLPSVHLLLLWYTLVFSFVWKGFTLAMLIASFNKGCFI